MIALPSQQDEREKTGLSLFGWRFALYGKGRAIKRRNVILVVVVQHLDGGFEDPCQFYPAQLGSSCTKEWKEHYYARTGKQICVRVIAGGILGAAFSVRVRVLGVGVLHGALVYRGVCWQLALTFCVS